MRHVRYLAYFLSVLVVAALVAATSAFTAPSRQPVAVVAVGDTIQLHAAWSQQGTPDSVRVTYTSAKGSVPAHKSSGATSDVAVLVPSPAIAPGETLTINVTAVPYSGGVAGSPATASDDLHAAVVDQHHDVHGPPRTSSPPPSLGARPIPVGPRVLDKDSKSPYVSSYTKGKIRMSRVLGIVARLQHARRDAIGRMSGCARPGCHACRHNVESVDALIRATIELCADAASRLRPSDDAEKHILALGENYR